MRKYFVLSLILALVCVFSYSIKAGMNDRFSNIELGDSGDSRNAVIIPEISAPPGDPASNYGWLYVKDSGGASALYFENDAGAVSQLTPSSTAYDDIGDPDADTTIVFDDDEINVWTFADTDEDMFNIQGLGIFGDVSVVRIEQVTGNATDGTVLEVVAEDPDVDPLVVSASGVPNAFVVGQLANVTIAGVATGTDALTLTDGDITLTDGDLTLDTGDVVITLGSLTLSDAVGGDLNVGDDLVVTSDMSAVGGTFTGNISAVDGTFSGNLLVTGALQLDDLIPASGAPHDITINGAGAGGVVLGDISTGNITLGDTAGATTVNLPIDVDLTLSRGDVTVVDTANTDTVAITNNTATTANLMTLTGNAQTSGDGISYVNSGAVLTGSAYYAGITDGAGFTGYYFRGYETGVGDDFAVKRYGATTITGLADTDVLTVTTGDAQIDDGKLEIDTDEDDTTKIERAQATVTGPVLSVVEQTDTVASNQAALFIDTDSVQAGSYGILVDTEGATGLHFIDLIAAGNGITFSTAAAYTGQLISVDDTLVGTTGEGIVDIKSSGSIATGATMLRVENNTGTIAGATDGFLAYFYDNSAAEVATSYAVNIESVLNEALHVDDGLSLFDETATFTAGIYSVGASALGSAATDSITALAAFQGATPIILDGATDDAFTVTLGVTDPESSTVLTLPDGPVSGAIASIVSVGTTQTSEGTVAVADITGSTIAIPANHPVAGQVYTWEIAGTKTGANNTFAVLLWALDGAVMTLTSPDAAAGDWIAKFKMYITGGATQKISGELLHNGKVAVTDYATGAKDLATAGGNVKAQISNGNVGDTTTSEIVTVTFNE